jgi:hypothetical protein
LKNGDAKRLECRKFAEFTIEIDENPAYQGLASGFLRFDSLTQAGPQPSIL